MDRYRPSQGDGSVTQMTVRYGECMRTSRKIRVIRRGMAHIKGILFESEDPESTLSGSETQETRPGWPRMTCAQIRLVTRGHSTTETVRDYGY